MSAVRADTGGSTSAASGQDRPCLLVVDDQPINIQALYQVFAPDYQVVMATSGAKALALCRQSPPDLVLLDVVMPGMDGHEVCAQLKADPATRHIPVIFVTARDHPSEEARGLELGAVDFIAKPISPSVVRARVQTHIEFARSRALLAATLEATADGILVVDLSGGVMTFNQRFADMWRLSPGDLQGASADALHGLMQDQLAPEFRGEAIDESMGFSIVQLREQRFFERYVTSLQGGGKNAGHVVSFRDVTQRRLAERNLAQLNASLETRIDERTQQLDLALQMASAASQAKSDFLSNMSHEIRTPMNSILGMAYLALRADPSPKLRDYLLRINQSGRHLLEIISDILDFSKIEAGKLDLEVLDFDLEAVFDQVAAQQGDVAREKGLDLVFDLDPLLTRPMRGDSLRLGQVLLNYVSNAIKFSAQGEIRVSARPLSQDDSGALVRFEVRDQGIGLSPQVMSGLFQSFQQADPSTTRKYGGTGLGLAICKKLSELMGGELGVDSEPDKGSTFWITVPLQWGTGAGPGIADEVVASPEEVARLMNRRILIVDDNALNRRVATELLESKGAVVSVAGNGQEAIEQLHLERVDCVLMDVQMPVMDGLEATRLIRSTPELASVRIIAMTANARRDDEIQCIEAGMDDFISKPVMPEELYVTVCKWLPSSPATVAADAGKAVGKGAVPDSAATMHSDSSPAATLAGDPEVIDLSVLVATLGGRLEMLRDVTTLFLSSTRTTIADIESALERQDVGAVKKLGHRAKSSSAAVGAVGLSRLCQALEALEGPQEVDRGREILERIRPLTARIAQRIEAALGASV